MEKNVITKSVGAKRMAEILANTNKGEAAKARKAADRMSRAARTEHLAELGVKVVTPVTTAASEKFAKAEEIRKDFEAARRAAKAAEKAEMAVFDAAWASVEEATRNPNKGFNSFAKALEKAKATR